MVQSMDQGAIVGAMYGASDRSGRILGATDGGLVSSVQYIYEIKSIVNSLVDVCDNVDEYIVMVMMMRMVVMIMMLIVIMIMMMIAMMLYNNDDDSDYNQDDV